MSISSALSNAYSGLSAVSRSAEVVSNNVSNALTPGYTRQQVSLSARVIGAQGGGVTVLGINRAYSAVLTQLRRAAESDMVQTKLEADALDRIARNLGNPGESGALATEYSRLDTSLRNYRSAPDSLALQQQLLSATQSIARTFNRISDDATLMRVKADHDIAHTVSVVNQSLTKIAGLNAEIRKLVASGANTATLQDKRQTLVDTVNSAIPVRQSISAAGDVVLFGTGGEVLLNGSPRILEFTATPNMTSAMTSASGALSGLTINGQAVDIEHAGEGNRSGSLAANFRVRDSIAPKFQGQLDALAADLVGRMQSTSADPTLVAGAPGIFTDNGAAYTTANQVGISGRIAVNTLVDPASGGQLWRFRDGLGSSVQGLSGNEVGISMLIDALDKASPSPAALGIPGPMSAPGFAGELTGSWAAKSEAEHENRAFSAARFSMLHQAELKETGVDTDKEMQDLLVVKQAYAANARVISVIDGLMKTLLEM